MRALCMCTNIQGRLSCSMLQSTACRRTSGNSRRPQASSEVAIAVVSEVLRWSAAHLHSVSPQLRMQLIQTTALC